MPALLRVAVELKALGIGNRQLGMSLLQVGMTSSPM